MNTYAIDYRLGALHSIYRLEALYSIRHTGLFRKWLTPRRARIQFPLHLNPILGLFLMISYISSNDKYYILFFFTFYFGLHPISTPHWVEGENLYEQFKQTHTEQQMMSGIHLTLPHLLIAAYAAYLMAAHRNALSITSHHRSHRNALSITSHHITDTLTSHHITDTLTSHHRYLDITSQIP